MNIWYFCAQQSESCNAPSDNLTHFCGNITVLRPAQSDTHTTYTLVSENECGPLDIAFRISYSVMKFLQRNALRGTLPDAVIMPVTDAVAYFPLLDKLTQPGLYANCIFWAENGAARSDTAPNYLLPYWWIGKQKDFCLRAADGILLSTPETILTDRPVCETEQSDAVHFLEKCRTVPSLTEFPFLTQREQSIPPHKNKKSGLLSIIIPFYNMGETVTQTVQSAFACDYAAFEVILIDDGSTDVSSLDVLKILQTQYPNLRVIHQDNSGLSAVRNRGCALAEGEFITFLDADDTVSSSYYSRCIAVLQQYANVGYCGSWLEFFGDRTGVQPYFCSSLPALLLHNSQASFCVSRTEVYAAFGKNAEGMRSGFEDHDSWICLASHGWFGVSLPQTLCQYRLRENSMSAQFSRDETHQKQMRLYENLAQLHTALYAAYSTEIYNLLLCNGPAFGWNGTGAASEYTRLVTYLPQLEKNYTLAKNHIANLENGRAYRIMQKLRSLFIK